MTRPLPGLVLLATALVLAAPSPARAQWSKVGTGDCAGPEAGASKGLSPARAKCNASMGGMTAVCWDGTSQINPAVKGAGCFYRMVRAEACQGGPHPGTLYRCDGFPLATPKPAKAAPAAKAGPAKTSPAAAKPAPAEPAEEAPPETAESATRRKVQGHLNKAADLFSAKDYEGALQELRQAQQSQDLAVVRFNIARCLEELERAEEAIQAYQDYLTAPDVAAGADVRRGYANQAVAMLSGVNEQPPETPPSETLAWKLLRVDDCLGEEVGNSDGMAPASALCVPATAGNAAVCWDGQEHKHPAFKGPACVYKSVLASACKGGPHPGVLYECASRSGGTSTASTIAGAAGTAGEMISYAWQYVGPGDCAGGDTAKTKGAEPAAERCNAAKAGKLAVCWDGMTQRNPALKGAGCTYKGISAKACKPGSTPGLVFECVAENDVVSQLLGPPPAPEPKPASPPAQIASTPAPQPAPAKPGRWVPAGTGDCVGAPMGISKGLGPARAKCDSNHQGQVAICWDGAKQKNPALRGAGCSYQATKAERCRGGPHPGALYRCGP